MEISFWCMGLNEEKNLPKLFAPLKDIKDKVYVDHGSTDNSVAVAKSLGARVYVREFIHDIATQDDVDEFKKRFYFDPMFKVGDKIRHSGKERTAIQKLCKNDWILNLDCDEVLTWDYKKVLKQLPKYNVVNCRFWHKRKADGSRDNWVLTTKLYNRAKTWWVCRIHEALDCNSVGVGWTEDMDIDHFPEEREYKRGYVDHLEYAVLRENDTRSLYYLGQEYRMKGMWEKAIQLLIIYIKEAVLIHEKVKAYLLLADCLWVLGREDEAWVYATQALKYNPNSEEAFMFLSNIVSRKDREIWLEHADLAENDHLL